MSSPPLIPLALLTCSPRVLDMGGHSLRSVATAVDEASLPPALRPRVVEGLVRALFSGAPGVGLAAPMAGLGLRLVVMAVDGRTLVMANPRIVRSSPETDVQDEGNLCLPGVRAPVRRATEITVTWEDPLGGRERTEAFSGWPARILQHEIEILDGRLFLDAADGRPLGAVAKPEDQAARAAARIFGEPVPSRSAAELLTVATFDPDLAALPASVVRRAAGDVDLDRTEPALLRRVAEGLLRTQFAIGGVGLAAPQVGLHLRMAAIDDREQSPLLLINPEIVDRDDDLVTAAEGCLTLPGWIGPVPRARRITVRNHTPGGEVLQLEVSGHLARIVQHEIDHLDGVLFTDRMVPGSALDAAGGAPAAAAAVRAL